MQQTVDLPEGGLVLSRHEDAKAALHNRDLSRRLDTTTFAEGNVRERTLSVLHGTEHRDRRRLENALFRVDRLTLYERELFPAIVRDVMGRVAVDGRADLYHLGRLLSVVLSARTAGIDRDGSVGEIEELAAYVAEFAQATAIEDTVGDRAAVRRRVLATLERFRVRFLVPSRERRQQADGEGAPVDVLTILLAAQDREHLGLDDDMVLREVANYLVAGSHTSATTVINTLLQTIEWADEEPTRWDRLRADRLLVQRCAHEALRLRPTNPGIRRIAEVDTAVEEHTVRQGQLVVLDMIAANTDPATYGEDAAAFAPDRVVPDGVARWGLSMGEGMHACIGRTLAIGLPVRAPDAVVPAEHLPLRTRDADGRGDDPPRRPPRPGRPAGARRPDPALDAVAALPGRVRHRARGSRARPRVTGAIALRRRRPRGQ